MSDIEDLTFVYHPDQSDGPVIPDGAHVGRFVLHDATTGQVRAVSPAVLVVQLDGEGFTYPIEEGTTHE